MASITMATSITAAAPGRRRRHRCHIVASAGEPARLQEPADGRRGAMIAAAGAAAAAATALAAVGRPARAAGDLGTFEPWKQVSVDDPKVREVARFAVNEHSSETSQFLRLDKVLTAFRQVSATGYNYSLLLSASGFEDSKPVRYVAEVYRTTLTGQCFRLLYFTLA